MKCSECGRSPAEEHRILGHVLCRACRDKYPCLTLTEAKKRTLLREEELFELHYALIERENGDHYYLLLQSEVEEANRKLPEEKRAVRQKRRLAGHKAAATTFETSLDKALKNAAATLPSEEEVEKLKGTTKMEMRKAAPADKSGPPHLRCSARNGLPLRPKWYKGQVAAGRVEPASRR